MTPEQEQGQLDALAIKIKETVEAAYQQMMRDISDGMDSREAIAKANDSFQGEYYDQMAASFSKVLGQFFSVADMKAWPIGDVELSNRLYVNSREVSAVTRKIISDHVKGFAEIRDLARKLYDGYDFGYDPLKVKANLPKYMRRAIADPATNFGVSQVLGRIQASTIKTDGMRAAYLQAIDAVENGAGQERLAKLIKTAWYERNRYFANRIAQTELHRAYTSQQALDLMADDQVSWVQIRMSITHPKSDICDLHSKVNKYGKGPGCYPKAFAPKPPYHPFCRCKVIPRYDLEGTGQYNDKADLEFVKSQGLYDQQQILGSKQKLHDFLHGTPIGTIINRGVPDPYKLRFIGDPLDGLPIKPSPEKPPAPDPAPIVPGTKYWDAGTEAGKWHDQSFDAAPDWIKRAIGKYKDAPVTYRRSEGAYCKMRELINMSAYTKDGLRGQSVWRHEFGHWIDGWLGNEHSTLYGSMMSDFENAMKLDGDALKIASGVARSDAKNRARLDVLRSTYDEQQALIVGMDGFEQRVSFIRGKWETLGFDFDDVVRQLVIHDSVTAESVTTTGHLSDLVRMNKMATAIAELDAQGFMDAICGDNRVYIKTSFQGAFPEFSDLVGCATKNKVSGYLKTGYGHSDSYLKRFGAQGTEVFANVIALQGLGSPFWIRLSEVFMKNTIAVMKERLQ